jgi:hypothetical protein
MAEFKLPTETVKLPSKGLVYPKENPLSSGEIEMKYMTAKEEDILTNSNYIQQGVAFDKLFQSMIVSKINYDDLIVGDKDAIMIAARILGYGKNYSVKYRNPATSQEEPFTVDLTTIKEKVIDESLFNHTNEFTYTLPASENIVTFKLLTHADEKLIDQEIKSTKKINVSNEVTTRLKYQILSVNGDYEKKTVREFVDRALLASDSMAFRKHIKKISPGMDLTFTFVGSDGYVEEGVALPIELSFFYPEL